MKTNSLYLGLIFLFTCVVFLPGTQAITPPPDGCYPNFTTAEGCSALNSLTTGAGNSGFGWYALFSDSNGGYNTAVGGGALALNDGDNNSAVGAGAMLLNTSGADNVAVGTNALLNNDFGDDNNAIGSFALFSNTGGSDNNAHGGYALTDNLGDGNNAFGFLALESNTTGSFNTAMGGDALGGCIDGSENVAVGDEAGTGILHGTNIIAIGESVSGVSSVFGEVDDSCYIGNISGAEVDTNTAAIVMVDADGKLGTVGVDASGNRMIVPLKGANPAPAVPRGQVSTLKRAKKQAVLECRVEELKATVIRQQKQIEALTSVLQKVSARLELSKPLPQKVVNN
jgi:hypothetical protein